MDELVEVNIRTEEERWPVLSIGPAEEGNGRPYIVPRALFDALTRAREMVDMAEAAIMEHAGEQRPDDREIADWLRARRNGPRFEAARAAFDADHPDGPDWTQVADATRLRYLDAAGYER